MAATASPAILGAPVFEVVALEVPWTERLATVSRLEPAAPGGEAAAREADVPVSEPVGAVEAGLPLNDPARLD